METLIIHTETKQQSLAFEQMAKAMNLSLEKNENINFEDEFRNAISIELAEKIAIKNVKKSWQNNSYFLCAYLAALTVSTSLVISSIFGAVSALDLSLVKSFENPV